jgi:hypothetical protein
MKRFLEKHLTLVLLVLAVGVTVACSSSTTGSSGEPDSVDGAADALTKG